VTNACRVALAARDFNKEMRGDSDAFGHVVRAENEMITLCEGMARAEKGEQVKALLNWFVEAPRSYLEWGEFSNLRPL
jgi:hypothetical protein